MINIAILGYGVVGSGVYHYLEGNADILTKRSGRRISVQKILVRRDFLGDPAEKLMTRDINEILFDDKISIVAECMGGLEPAYSYVMQALLRGKSVVTSNKLLVAEHGARLLQTAADNKVRFLFEASVGGGVPLIAPISRNLITDRVTEIAGILNGTTNFILSEMSEKGRGYSQALKEAQALGFAESDPSADTEGLDTGRKLAILISLVSGRTADWKEVDITGIMPLTEDDFRCAKLFGYTIKLLGIGKLDGSGTKAITAPFLLRHSDPLAVTGGVFNCAVVSAEQTGPVIFYGKGAGKAPTAAAVASDITEAARRPINDGLDAAWSADKITITPFGEYYFGKLIRAQSKALFADKIRGAGNFKVISSIGAGINEWALEVPPRPGKDALEKLEALSTEQGVKILSVLRVYGGVS